MTPSQALAPRRPGTGGCTLPVPGWPPPGRAARVAALTVAAGLAAELCCEVTPHPVLPEKFEAVYPGGVLIGTAAELRASERGGRRLEMLAWLWFFRSLERG